MTPRCLWMGLFIAAVVPAAFPRAAAVPPEVRIGLYEETSVVTLGTGPYLLSGRVAAERGAWKKPPRLMIAGAGFIVNKERWGKKVVLEPAVPGGTVVVNRRPYRGRIEVERTGPAFRVVNVLSVEDYVRGVLERETSSRWPEQALKAQAVISRTYAVRNRGRHGRAGFDFCASPHCQTYGGAAAERSPTDAAVRATRGEVLVDARKRLISAVYHSCCGGSTESAENVWESEGQPYLKPVSCPWCRGTPHAVWVARFSNEVLTRRLASAGYGLGAVRAIGILSHTPSGRVYRVRIYGQRRDVDLKANALRNLVDPQLIRSTFWSGLSRRGDTWRIHGRGWGHGVGLCQWGMKALAEKNMTYGQILRYYYRGVSVRDGWE